MTPAQLQTKLTALLANQLGTYRRSNGSTLPAVRFGEPDEKWTCSGLEVMIEAAPEYDNAQLHASTAVVHEWVVRFIPHDADMPKVRLAVDRVCQAFNASNPTTVPKNQVLGIETQYALRIRS